MNHSRERLGNNAKRTKELSLPTGPGRDLVKLNTKPSWNVFLIWEGIFPSGRLGTFPSTEKRWVKWQKLNGGRNYVRIESNGRKSQTQRYFHMYGLCDILISCSLPVYGGIVPPWDRTTLSQTTPLTMAKRSQHFKATSCNIVGHTMLYKFSHPVAICCNMLQYVGWCWLRYEEVISQNKFFCLNCVLFSVLPISPSQLAS